MLVGSPSVHIRGLRKVYTPSPWWLRVLARSPIKEPVTAIADLSLDVGPGTLCAVVGPNGAGKSTLFRLLTGITTPDSGSIVVCGLDPVVQGRAVRRLIGFMPADDRTLYLRHTCTENLEFHGRLHQMPKADLEGRVRDTLDLVGLGSVRDRTAFALSSGMRARLQLARALLHQPQVLILDEPTGSVDPVSAFDLLELIQTLTTERGLATVISSHRLEEIEALRDNVLLMHRGRVVYRGHLDQVREEWTQPRIALTFATERDAMDASGLLQRAADVEHHAIDGATVTVSSGEGAGRVLAALDGRVERLRSVTESKPSLRDLLRDLLADTPRTYAHPEERGENGTP